MSAEKWHEDTTNGESTPPLISLWSRAIEHEARAARRREAQPEAGELLKPAPDDQLNSNETLATLLRVIESTDISSILQGKAPRIAQPDQSELPELPAPNATIPASTLPVDKPPSVAPTQVAGSPEVHQPGPLPDY